MAEAALLLAAQNISLALGKEALTILSSQLKKEVSLLTELPSSMNRIRREFVLMQSMLSEIDTEQETSKSWVAWLEEVRKVANDAQDIVDKYIHLLGGKHRNGLFSSIKIWIDRSPNILEWREIASKLKELETEISHVSQIRDRWIKIPEGAATSSSTYAVDAQQRLPDSSVFIEDADFTANKKQRKMLTDWLAVDQEDPGRCSIISVWGMGGSGKTTLVHNVYKTEQGKFGCHAWITVSQTYAIEDLLRRLVEKLYEQNRMEKPEGLGTKNGGELKQMLQVFLKDRRYLIVLDDVWSPTAFQGIKDAFVENGRGSRIVITTRIGDVANLADDDHKLELKGLEEGEAWELFCKRAFWRDKERKCPPVLQDTAKKILSKCDGLPLAIVSIGSLMSLKEKTKAEWEKVYKQLEFELDKNENLSYMKQILNLSYKSLPRHLKNCFLYCSFFPEDYEFGRKELIRLWVAEEFVEEVGERTMEEVADDYLKELSQRCMLQVVGRNSFGRMRRFQMHDVVRDLAISISKRENFTAICGNQEARINNEARRLSVLAGSKHIESLINLRQLRSFLVFTDEDIQSKLLSQLLSSCRYLMVLNLQGSGIESVPEEVGYLFNLQYLNLSWTRVKGLPKSIKRLHNLQTLDVRRTEITKLPGWITKLRNLRHLLVGVFHVGVPMKHIKGPRPPNFRGLQTLKTVESSIEVVEWLGHSTQLRTLEITDVEEVHCAKLCSSIAKMRFLSNLFIEAAEGTKLVLAGLDPPLQNLEKLTIYGELDSELDAESSFFRSRHVHDSLRELSLFCSGFRQDPLPFLCSMSNLSLLRFDDNAYQGQRLLFRKGWFPHLNILQLDNMPNLDKVMIEEGAMERLENLQLWDLPKLKDIPEGIESLATSLREIRIGNDMHSEFRERIEKSDIRGKVRHVGTHLEYTEADLSELLGQSSTYQCIVM